MTADAPAVTSRRFGSLAKSPRHATPRQTFWGVLVAFTVASTLWSLANPLMASADEPAHMVKAAATVRGQMTGEPIDHPIGGVEDFEVPALITQVAPYANCLAFQAAVTAACQPEVTGNVDGDTVATSSAARYNPIYYAVIGLPSLAPTGEVTIYLMRAMSGLFAALGLAFAARTLAEMRSPSWLLTGLLVSVTPAVLYLTSSINPQGIEVVGALGVWVILLALLRDPDPALVARRMGRLAFAAILLANARGMGPFFLALIVLACVASAPWSRTWDVLRDRRAWFGLSVCVVGSLVGLGWILTVGSLPTPDVALHPENTPRAVFQYTIDRTSYYIEGMMGVFGWLDTPLPGWLYMLLGSMISLVAFLGFALGRVRDRLVLIAVFAAVALLPIAIHIYQAPQMGVFWQGRYILPLAFGVPILGAFALRHGALDGLPELGSRLQRWVGLVIVTVQVVAFAVNLHRYINGINGGWVRLDANSWTPPLHPVLLVVMFGAACLALAEIFYRAAQPRQPEVTSEPAPEPVHEVSGVRA